MSDFGSQKTPCSAWLFWALLSGSSLSCLEVIETDPEPAHTVLEESSREVELCLSAVVDYAEFKLDMHTFQFKKTLLFQTRMFRWVLETRQGPASGSCFPRATLWSQVASTFPSTHAPVPQRLC